MNDNDLRLNRVASYNVSPELVEGMATQSGTGIPAVLGGDMETGGHFLVANVLPNTDNDLPVLTGSFVTRIVTDEGLRVTSEAATAIPVAITGVAAAVRRLRRQSSLRLDVYVDRPPMA